MNLILLLDEDLSDETPQNKGIARLRGRRARHIQEVHRAQVGDTLIVGRQNGLVGQGKVLSSSPEEVRLEIHLESPPPAPLGIELLLALPRPKVLRRVLGAIASLGVKRLVLVNSYRVEKSYFDSPLLSPDAVLSELRLGLEQARDTVLPVVQLRQRFKPFVEDELPLLWPASTQKLLAHPTAAEGLESCGEARRQGDAVVAIGPEGGWIPFEVERLKACGFLPFTLGPRILRVETAVPLILGQLALLRRR